jgi:ubiquinol-cytochrome c reductase cytochrome b subunit
VKNALLAVWRIINDRLGITKNLKPIMDHRVPRESKWAYVFGSATLFAFILQVVTGVVLATVYVPSASGAYSSLEYISRTATLGHFVRGLHYFGASAMILFIGVHMLRVFLYAAYKFPREGNWLTGVVLLMFTLGMGFSGQLLRWDQTAIWSVNIAARQAVRVPFIGGYLQNFVYAGDRLNGMTLNHFFDLHVFIIPAMMFGFIGIHLYLVLYNGISEPPVDGVAVNPKTYRRRYKELVKKNGVPFWPDAAWRDALFGCLVIAGVVTCAFIFGAPHLQPPPDPTLLIAAPRPDWYLLWYFAILAMSPHQLESVIMILGPALVFGSMFALPFFFNSGQRSLRRRPWAVAWVTIVIVGVCTLWYEGAVSPWSPRFSAPALPAVITASLSPQAQRGAALFHDKRCESCHMIQGYGGLRGPNLTYVADHLTTQQMEWRILNGGHNMPSFAGILHPGEVDDILTFLHTRDLPRGTQLGQVSEAQR